MEKNFGEISMEDVKKLAQSEPGQQLMQMLRAHGGEMESAMSSAGRGDLQAAKEALSSFMADPRAQALLRRLQEERHG